MEIDERVSRFKEDIKAFDPLYVIRKNLVYGDCYALDNDKAFILKNEIANQFRVHPNDVFIVGSGKLGFSIAPRKLYREFGEESDIDVAIISERLFNKIWQDVHAFKAGGGYWVKEVDFNQYLFNGWIRPDYLPPAARFEYCKEWWEFFGELSKTGQYGFYKIAAGIYHSWHFFETYSAIAVNNCARRLEE